jgi:hypothetical protein
MITRGDDFPLHQTADAIAVAGSGNPNFYDRYFFNGYARDGSVFFAVALGQYPNRQIADAAFSLVHRGRQHVVRASRRAGSERMDTRVGPIAVEVLEPLRTLRVVMQPNAFDLSADLVFTARAGVIEEPRFHRAFAGHVFMDSTRLTQHVEVRGHVRIGGETIAIAPEHHWGSRDRSWGIRPIGARDAGAPAPPPQFFWLWAPVNFDDLCTHCDVNEDADGTRWHEAGMIVPVGGEPEPAAGVEHRIEFRPGTRYAGRAEIVLHRRAGDPLRIALEPLYEFGMVGLGYQHPVWGHGMWVGEDAVDGESWALADIDPAIPLHLHVQAVCRATCGERRGIGVLEQLIIGPHAPSGFRELLDMAR